MGTAYSILNAYNLGKLEERFFITYGDSFLQLNKKIMMDAYSDYKKNYMEIIENKSEFENIINNYLNKYILIGKLNMKGYILLDKLGNQKLYIKEKDKKIWTIGGSQDINYFENDFANKIVIIEPSKNLNDIIGFYTAIKNDYNDLTLVKKCCHCNLELNVSAFSKAKSSKSGYNSKCKDCYSKTRSKTKKTSQT